MTSLVDVLANRVLRERVADALGAEAIWPSVVGADDQVARAEAMRRLDAWLEVSSSNNSGVLSASWRVPSPALAQQVVRTFVEKFCGVHLRVHGVEGSQEFFAAQQALLRNRLNETAEALRQAKSGWI